MKESTHSEKGTRCSNCNFDNFALFTPLLRNSLLMRETMDT